MFKYYTFLFKYIGEAWSASKKFLACTEESAYTQALNYAEAHGYSDFILM